MGLRQPIASVMLRASDHYCAGAFQRGLARVGYDVRTAFPPTIDPRDVLVIWNRYAQYDSYAKRFEGAGARVLVCENGYLGKRTIALAHSQHNGAGSWPVGDASRVQGLQITLEPWRTDGDHILVLPQRGVGAPGVAMPKGWKNDVVRRLKAATKRPIRIREHPGAERPSLAPDLKNAWACVTWGSGAGIKAIVAGVPVFHELPQWIGKSAARYGLADIEQPFTGDRMPMLEALAWAQWSADEIENGLPFEAIKCA